MHRFYILFVSLAVVHACSLPINASDAHADCNGESAKLAEAVCGKFVRVTRTERQTLVLSQIEHIYQDQEFASKYPNDNIIERLEAFQVPHEDLVDELSNTRQCRIKMASLALDICLENNCKTSCQFESKEAQDRAAKAMKSYETCRKGVKSACVVDCRMNSNSGMKSHSQCKRLCARVDESECDHKRVMAQERDNVVSTYQACVVQCDR